VQITMASNVVQFDGSMCVICGIAFRDSSDSDISEVGRGLQKLLEYSEKNDDMELMQYLLSKPAVVKVHNMCRRNYTNKRRFEQKFAKADDDDTVKSKSLRSCTAVFDWKLNCFFCSQLCIAERQKDAKKMRHVETLEIRDSVLGQCAMRADAWGLEVQSRLLTCIDLVAAEAVYHNNCHLSFYRVSKYAACGRPTDSRKAETFEKLCEWLEVNDFEMLTLQDVATKAQMLVPENDIVYSEKWLKQKLSDRYGDHIQFNEVRGRRNVICWKQMAAYIVNRKWHEQQKANVSEHIIITAAKLLKATIREATYSMDSYPTCADVQDPQRASNWMPELLQVFLDHLICPAGKKVAVGHSIVQAVKPRSVIAPIPFALGVSVDHITGSKYLIDLLYKLGLSVSYDEVYRFKQSVTRCESANQPRSFPDCFTQYAADNVDHDVGTLDGLGTLHGMGIISISTVCENSMPLLQNDVVEVAVDEIAEVPVSNVAEASVYSMDDVPISDMADVVIDEVSNIPISDDIAELSVDVIAAVPIPRLKLVRSAEVAKVKRIPLLHYRLPEESMNGITFRPEFHACQPTTLPKSINLDLLWHVGWFVRSDEDPRPSWAGFNDSILCGNHAKASDIRMQPIIDLNPNDLSCIYSTLMFIAKDAEKLHIKTPAVTFDQPLWLKAVNIVNCHKLNIVCRLGAFHV
jgi:hypothetical protein